MIWPGQAGPASQPASAARSTPAVGNGEDEAGFDDTWGDDGSFSQPVATAGPEPIPMPSVAPGPPRGHRLMLVFSAKGSDES